MDEMIEKCAKSSDADLTGELRFVAERERRSLAAALVVLGEYGYRRLYRDEGYYSLFEYCLRVLKYDESAAYRHIAAARVIRQYPDALPLVASGDLSLTSLLILSPVLTPENRVRMFKDARGKSRRELETVVAGLCPLPPRGWQAVVPVSLERVRIGFDAAIALMRMIDRARQILRHKYPEGRLEDILRDSLQLLLDRKDPQRRLELKKAALLRDAEVPDAAAAAPEPRFLRAIKAGRYVPARVKEAVWERDGGRCAWRFEDGAVCGSREWLEYDHILPFAKGGRSDSPRNVRLLCRLHNGLRAEAFWRGGAARS